MGGKADGVVNEVGVSNEREEGVSGDSDGPVTSVRVTVGDEPYLSWPDQMTS